MALKTVQLDDCGKMTRFVAEIMPIMVNEALSDYEGLRSRLSVEQQMDGLMRRMIFSLRAYVAANQEEKRCRTFRWHATWWDHFKDEVMPDWFKRRYPVQWIGEEVQILNITRMCPHLPINDRNDGFWREHAEWLCYEIDLKKNKD